MRATTHLTAIWVGLGLEATVVRGRQAASMASKSQTTRVRVDTIIAPSTRGKASQIVDPDQPFPTA